MSRGFTLIELLVSIAILALLASSAFISYHSFSLSSDVKTTAFEVVDAMNIARQQTVASLNASNFGVHLEQTQFVIFTGTVYSALDTSNIAYTLPSTVEIANISLAGGGQDIVFDRITGKTSESGTFDIRASSDTSKTKTVEVLASGQSDVSDQTLPPSGTRISDTRRVYFTYNQNIQSAVTLTLNFPGYTSQNIDFQTYVSGGEFAWSGKVAVNGSNQVLDIHTLSMDASSAEFSVTRDLRYNNAALQISLDGQNLANYAVNGTVSQGSSLWVSAPISQ